MLAEDDHRMASESREPEHEAERAEAPEEKPGIAALLWQHKGWWLAPIVVVVLLLLALALTSGSQSLPFMYRLVERDAARPDPLAGAASVTSTRRPG
jgi:hypothetical protein